MTQPDQKRSASVLVSFSATNVRSFRDTMDLSMLATGLAEQAAVRSVTWREGGRPLGVLPVIGVFGANASGKTNALRAMDDMRAHVLHSFRDGAPTGGVPRRSFALGADRGTIPTRFEIDIVLDDVRHQYGFEIDDERVVSEWAYRYPRGRPALLFSRNLDDVELGAVERTKGRAVMELLRPNALFLSTAAAANHPVLLPIYEWFARNLLLAEAKSRFFRQAHTTELLADDSKRQRVLDLLRAADLGITGATRHDLDPVIQEHMRRALRILAGQEGEPESKDQGLVFDELGVRLAHQGATGEIELDQSDESLGTLVWFGLVGPVVEALVEGAVLLADELDASLHPALVAQLVQLFQDQVSNPRRAQLIFNSHDATLLGDSVQNRLIGRDQVWFTEKRSDGSTRLYPLSDLDPRKNEAVGRRYLAGRYGATPILSRQQFAAVSDLTTVGDST